MTDADFKKRDIEMLNKRFLKVVEKRLGNSTTYSDQLEVECRKLFGNRFIGVYSMDNWTPKIKKDEIQYYIINTDDSSSPGTHWLGLISNKGDTIVYDSFGRNLIDINSECSSINNIEMTEDDSEQDESQMNCGARCITWLIIYHLFGKECAKMI